MVDRSLCDHCAQPPELSGSSSRIERMFERDGTPVSGADAPPAACPAGPARSTASAQLLATLAGEPGPDALVQLAGLAPEELDHHDSVLLLQAWERQLRWVAAHAQRILSRVAGPSPRPGSDEEDWVCEEVAAALDLAPSTGRCRVGVARRLAGPLAATAAALAAGEISAQHAVALAEETAELIDEVATAVQDRVLAQAVWRTVPQLRRAVRRAVTVVDPVTAEAAHAAAVGRRTVERWSDRDGMAALTAWLPVPEADLVFTALDAGAARLGPDDPRGVDARRADVLVSWAVTALDDPARAAPAGHRPGPAVAVTVDLPTLLGLAENPGELAGYGPIPAGLARSLAADGSWRRLVTDPLSGTLLDYGRRTYAPPAALADFVRARDGTCRFPGCRVPAARCDLDHIRPFEAGGTTSADNLAALCRRHHRVKTFAGWTLALGADASVSWTSPAGRTYLVPAPRIRPDG